MRFWRRSGRPPVPTRRVVCHRGSGPVALLVLYEAIIGYFDCRIPAEQSPDAVAAGVALRKRARRRVRRSGAAKAIMRPAPARRDRRNSDVAEALAERAPAGL